MQPDRAAFKAAKALAKHERVLKAAHTANINKVPGFMKQVTAVQPPHQVVLQEKKEIYDENEENKEEGETSLCLIYHDTTCVGYTRTMLEANDLCKAQPHYQWEFCKMEYIEDTENNRELMVAGIPVISGKW